MKNSFGIAQNVRHVYSARWQCVTISFSASLARTFIIPFAANCAGWVRRPSTNKSIPARVASNAECAPPNSNLKITVAMAQTSSALSAIRTIPITSTVPYAWRKRMVTGFSVTRNLAKSGFTYHAIITSRKRKSLSRSRNWTIVAPVVDSSRRGRFSAMSYRS